MERNGGVARRFSHIKSTVTSTYTEDASVQESLWKLLLIVISALTSPFPSLESIVLAPSRANLSLISCLSPNSVLFKKFVTGTAAKKAVFKDFFESV
ncbi:hypothetical protein SADUNF_Sadunf01G0090600 [Salix dunnii]|uniref:Uncharacterized protein n=1 Tax=Salix dunnii TaxID=1413687 RepID=A0A835NAU5_9ROSI|nr:hypothetical protein SADUNF_Sadunf01G0090600 [Salix dunnii]